MDRMSAGVTSLILLSLAGAPARAQESTAALDRWTPLIDEAAARFSLPARWIRDVMAIESGGQTERDGRPIMSQKGALGLMQVLPDTYADMRRAYGLGPDPQDPRDNILAGAAYLQALHARFGWPGLFAAYNAGPARYEAYLSSGQTLPDETIAYVAALEMSAAVPISEPSRLTPRTTADGEPAVEIASGRSIFFIRNGVRAALSPLPITTSSDRRAAPLFVPLRRGHF